MNTCAHCGNQVVEFSFKTGKEWWHFNPLGGSQHRGCRDGSGRLTGTTATPAS